MTPENDGAWSIETLGRNPFVWLNFKKDYDVKELNQIHLEYKSKTGLDSLQIHFGPKLSPSNSILMKNIQEAADWTRLNHQPRG